MRKISRLFESKPDASGLRSPADIHYMTSTKDGFVIHFTAPIDKNIKAEDFVKALSMDSWFYTNTGKYGSLEHDKRKEEISSAKFLNTTQWLEKKSKTSTRPSSA